MLRVWRTGLGWSASGIRLERGPPEPGCAIPTMLGAGASDTVRFTVTRGREPLFTTIGSAVGSASGLSSGFSGDETAADGLPSLPTDTAPFLSRSEEHTSELQSQSNLVC